MAIIKSISVSKEFEELAREHQLSWSEASRIGMSILLSERGVKEYDNRITLVRKMRAFQEMAEVATQKLNEIEAEIDETKEKSE